MKSPLLVLDTHYLCHRAFHSTGELSWQGRATGVIFGFLNSISALKDEFQTDRIVFCFEHSHLHRRDIYPDYKYKRAKNRTEQEKKNYSALAIQISELRQRYLPKIGFKNIFCFRGMESDDIMAALAASYSSTQEVILVTSDADLWQCLGPNVSIFSPQKRKVYTEEWFHKTYQFTPSKWAVVKAIAGCDSDCVAGIKGVGEATALKFIRGELKKDSKAYRSIVSPEGKEIIRRNRMLVQLPYANCPTPNLLEDQITKKAWAEVCELLGMKSIRNRPPVTTGRIIPNG